MSPMTASEIGQRRREIGWTQAELAKRAGVSARTVLRLERGQRDPHPATLAMIEAALVRAESERCSATSGS